MKLKPYDPNANPVFPQAEQPTKYKLKPYDPNANPVFPQDEAIDQDDSSPLVSPLSAILTGGASVASSAGAKLASAMMEQGTLPPDQQNAYGRMMTGHIPDDFEVSPEDAKNPNWYAAKMTARDMGESALNVLPEAVAYSLPALMTGGLSVPMGLTATAFETNAIAAPMVTRAALTGLNTGVMSGTESAFNGDGKGFNGFASDTVKGAAIGAASELAGEGVIHGIGKVAKGAAGLWKGAKAEQQAATALRESSGKLDLPSIDEAIAKAGKVEDALNSASGPHAAPVRFNSAEVIDSPGLTNLQQKLNRLDSGAVEKAVDHRGTMNRAVTDLVEQGAGPKGAGTLDDTITATRNGLDDFNSGLNATEDGLQQEFSSVAGDVPSLEAAGRTGRQALDAQRSSMKRTVVNPAYDDIGNVQVQGDDLVGQLRQIEKPTSAGENPDNIPSSFLARIKKVMASGVDNQRSADLATLRDLEKEARQLKVNARTAQGNANQSLARRYQQIEEAIRGTIDNGNVASDAAPMLAESFSREADSLLSTSASNLVIDGHAQKAMISDAPDWFLNMNRNLPTGSQISKQAAANALKRAATGAAKGPLDDMVIGAARGEIEQVAVQSARKIPTGSLNDGDVFSALHPQSGAVVEARVINSANGKKTIDFGGSNPVDLDDTFDTVQVIGEPSSNALAPEAQKLRQANRTFRQFAETYGEGPVGEVLKKRGYEHAVKDADVMQRFFPKGTKEAGRAAASFRMASNGDPQAWQSLEDSVIRDMLDTVAPTGKVEPKKFASWYANHRGAMQQYPELQKKVGNVQRAQNALEDFWTRSGELRQQTETSVLKEFLKADPDRAISRILDSRNPVAEVDNLLQLVGDNPHARNGIKRETMAYMKGRITTTRKINGKDVLSGAGMKKTYAKLKPTLKKIYSPSELRDIEIAIEAEEMMNRAWNPQLSGSNTTEIAGPSFSLSAEGARAVGDMIRHPVSASLELGARIITKVGGKIGIDSTRKVLLNAMDDPKALRELIAATQAQKPDSAIAKFLKKYPMPNARPISAAGAAAWVNEE